MSGRDLRRQLRALWATLAAILALAAGVAVGLAWYTQGELEREATRDARKLAVEVLQPALTPADAEAPIHGTRYAELQATVQERILAGPVNGVRLWRADGTILFSDDPELVGVREAEMRDDIHAVVSGTARSWVQGDRFRTLTTLRIGDPPALVAAELDRPHSDIVAEARARWYPWATRAGVAAGVCVGLFVATSIFSALMAALERGARRRRASAASSPLEAIRRAPAPASPEDLPAYMHPGFQEEVEARRKVEKALQEAERERDELRELVRRLELELDQVRRSSEGDGSRPHVPAR
jgi:hypothetical protein